MSLSELLLEHGQHAAGWSQASREALRGVIFACICFPAASDRSVIAVHKHNQRCSIRPLPPHS